MNIAFVLGTRPEVIKLAPVIIEAQRRGHRTQVVLSGQHGHLVAPLLRFFQLDWDVDLSVMVPSQTLSALSARVLTSLDAEAGRIAPDCLVTQGDTTTAFCSAYWAFCRGIPVVHVEAGLRTGDMSAPFPEEGNRQLIARLAQIHFAPTAGALAALKREGVTGARVRMVGNTGIDALHLAIARLERAVPSDLDPETKPGQHACVRSFVGDSKLVLVTAHRRESFGAPFENICEGLRQVASERHDVRVVYPVHPNPEVQRVVRQHLEGRDRILLCDPLPYPSFVDLMRRASVIVTDSGGVQEEGPSLKVPIVVLRDVTERPEGVAAGFSRLVGTDPAKVCEGVTSALDKGCQGQGPNPYGDGQASIRILDVLERARELRPVAQFRSPTQLSGPALDCAVPGKSSREDQDSGVPAFA